MNLGKQSLMKVVVSLFPLDKSLQTVLTYTNTLINSFRELMVPSLT
jgi:hypothetical protein